MAMRVQVGVEKPDRVERTIQVEVTEPDRDRPMVVAVRMESARETEKRRLVQRVKARLLASGRKPKGE